VLLRTTIFEHIFVRLSSSCICVRSYREGLTKWPLAARGRLPRAISRHQFAMPDQLDGTECGSALGRGACADQGRASPLGVGRTGSMLSRGYAVLVQDAVGIAELSRADFLAYIESFLTIYAAAMGAAPDELPSREAIMQRHAGNPGFRALAVYRGTPARIVAFTYGFHGQHGQWWHDVVNAGIAARADVATANGWLDDVVEIAEVHVHPEYQARGIGRQMVLSLAAGRTEQTAVLSTRDGETPARRLYRSLGFVDLLTAFLFPGGGPAYAVMGATLPLLDPGQ
jgi:ribosomal protein S18 acetylase RimI-like enzyme